MHTVRLAGSILALSLTVAAFSSNQDERAIRAVYARLQHAMLTKNVSAIEQLEGPGFTDTEHGMTMDAKKANAEMKQQFSMARFTQCHITVTNISVSGKNAVAQSRYTMDAVAKVQGKSHRLHMTGTTHDQLLKTKRGWLFTYTKDTTEHETEDGKPIPM